MVTPLDRNAATFLEKTIIQSWPKIWLHNYSLYNNDSTFRKKTIYSYQMCFIPSM